MDGAPRLSSEAGREAKKAPNKTGALSAGYAIDLMYNIVEKMSIAGDYYLQRVAETRILCGIKILNR